MKVQLIIELYSDGARNFIRFVRTVIKKEKTVDSGAVLQAIEANLPTSTRSVLGKLGTSRHVHNLRKSIVWYWIVSNVTKSLQNIGVIRLF